MNQKKLIKELGWKSTLRVRDFYGALFDPEIHKELSGFVEIGDGDLVSIVVVTNKESKRLAPKP